MVFGLRDIGMSRSRRAAALGAATAAVAIMGIVVALTLPGQRTTKVGGLDAYLWCHSPRSVAAQWTVPVPRGNPSASAEATWIGVTGPAKQLIQIGTQEYFIRDPYPRGMAPLPPYEAFWSDGLLYGAPQKIGTVHPGDHVSASASMKPGGWILALHDATQMWSWSHIIDYTSPGIVRGCAAWVILEDPAVHTVSDPMIHFPALTVPRPFTMGHLLVNGLPPTYAKLLILEFTAPSGITYSPGVLFQDGFPFLGR